MSAPRRALIVNADDFGFSDHTVTATIECFDKRVISSASLMPNMPAFARAAEYALAHPEFGYGFHLCLTDEKPLSSPDTIPTLVDPAGRLWPTRQFWLRAFLGRLSQHDLQLEMMSQIQQMLQTGINPTHLDSHGHIHKAPCVMRALAKVLPKSGIAALRRTQDVFYPKRLSMGGAYNLVANRFISRLGRTPDHFLMVAGRLGEQDSNWWVESVKNLPEGVTEIGIHPGWDEEWRKLECTPVLDDNGVSIRQNGVNLVDYRYLTVPENN